MTKARPTPEQMLVRAEEEERQAHSGKLKIYLGAAPGVGKTFSMLQDARSQLAQGLDILVGVVESHGRQEIKALLEGFKILPQVTIEYHGKQISEFDLDAALKNHPTLILMDEMAHTNAPGSRHEKRWQDIKELLDRGIDVHTTLNVQHIESLNDVVAQITRIHVRETVPDFMLEIADTIELVDLPPDDLLKRLQEGKVYIPAQADIAKENFFRKGNLTALRELALRVTAERVEAQVLWYRHGQRIQHVWPTKERLLVCVGSHPKSAKIIRAARRMAVRLRADWIAIHVETPRIRLSDYQRNVAIQNLRLAEQLGAETKILNGLDIVNEVISFARERNVTKIVMGKSIRARWRDWIFGSLVDEIVRYSGEIDIYIIHGDTATPPPLGQSFKSPKTPSVFYFIAFAVVLIITEINFLLSVFLGLTNLMMIYLLGIVIVSLLGKTGPAIFASILTVLALDFFFIPPQYSFAFKNVSYMITLFIMLLVSYIISQLTIFSRHQAEASRASEKRTDMLNTLTRQLSRTRGMDKLLEVASRYISEVFDSEVMILMPEQGYLKIRARYRSTQLLNTKEESIARWVFDLKQNAGLGSDTLPFSDSLYVPLLGSKESVGVLRLRPSDPERLLIPEQLHFLEACARQIALALEVEKTI